MKNILLFSMLALVATSCTKSVQVREEMVVASERKNTQVTALTEMSAFFGTEERIQVSVKPEAYVICESFQDAETPKPCNIYINFTCTLSQATDRYVRVEVERNNIVQIDNANPVEGDTTVANPPVFEPGARIALIIPPNTTTMLFRSALSNPNNNTIRDNDFKILSAGFYTPVD